MPCDHRFINELIPSWKVRYLFIGTFNPEWDSENGNNAEYFYGRQGNQFWEILPKIITPNIKDSLICKSREIWKAYCKENEIGLTDLIKKIKNADENNEVHKKLLTVGYEDKKIVESGFELEFNTLEIIDFITQNKSSIEGIYLTRKSRIKTIWDEWKKIKEACRGEIYCGELYSPSVRARRCSVEDKIEKWKREINKRV